MKALIIPEDFRKDQYILKPIFSRLLHQLGAKNVKVEVCRDPLLGGVGEALKLERIKDIVQRYKGMINFFVLCVDRDGVRERRQRLDQIEAGLKCGPDFVAENAWEEIETWVLAGLDLPSEWKWSDVRAEVQVKEIYFEQYAAMHGLVDLPGGGRKTLGEEASHRVKNIRKKCPEDFDALAKRPQMYVLPS